MNTSSSRSGLRGSRHIALLLAALVVSPFLITLGSAPATAVDNGSLGIRPKFEADFLHANLASGAAMDTTAIISNHSAEDVTLLTYAVDGETTPQGAFALAGQSDARTGVGAWVTLDADSIVVPADSEVELPFRLSVPANVSPGDYAGGLIIQEAPVQGQTTNSNGDTAVRIDVIQRQGMRIYLTVDGEAAQTLSTGNLSWSRSGDNITFTQPITNTGNMILHPSATLDVHSWIGATKELDFTTPESILPGATLNLQATLSPAPFLQIGRAEAVLTSEAGIDRVSTNFVYIPWWILLIILLLLAALVFALVRWWVLARRSRHASAEADAGAGAAASVDELQIFN